MFNTAATPRLAIRDRRAPASIKVTRTALARLALALLAAVSYKVFLAAQIGPEVYQGGIDAMFDGSLAERAAAALLMLDGVSQVLSQMLHPFLG